MDGKHIDSLSRFSIIMQNRSGWRVATSASTVDVYYPSRSGGVLLGHVRMPETHLAGYATAKTDADMWTYHLEEVESGLGEYVRGVNMHIGGC